MNCNKCGNFVPAGQNFCNACGAPVQQTAPVTPATPTPPSSGNGNVVKIIVLAVLGLIVLILLIRALLPSHKAEEKTPDKPNEIYPAGPKPVFACDKLRRSALQRPIRCCGRVRSGGSRHCPDATECGTQRER